MASLPKQRYLARLLGYDCIGNDCRPVFATYCCSHSSFYGGFNVGGPQLAKGLGYHVEFPFGIPDDRPVLGIFCCSGVTAGKRFIGRFLGYDCVGGDCRPVIGVGCCPPIICGCIYGIPDTLYLTLTGDDAGTVVTLTRERPQFIWSGDFLSTCRGSSSTNIHVVLYCISPDFGGGWQLCFSCDPAHTTGSCNANHPGCPNPHTPYFIQCPDPTTMPPTPLILDFAVMTNPGCNCSGPCGIPRWGGEVTS